MKITAVSDLHGNLPKLEERDSQYFFKISKR